MIINGVENFRPQESTTFLKDLNVIERIHNFGYRACNIEKYEMSFLSHA